MADAASLLALAEFRCCRSQSRERPLVSRQHDHQNADKALLQKILGVEWNSRRSVFLARKLLFLTARSRALPLSGDCSKPVAIKRRNIFL
jgi:hypothetical protein